MGRFPVFVLLLLLSVSIFCFSAGEKKDHGFHIGHVKEKLNRPELRQGRIGLCLCPGRVHHPSHDKRKHLPHYKHLPRHLKQKCRSFQRNCQHRHLMNGLQIPL